MSDINIKPTKRYDTIKEMLEDTSKMYGSQDAFRYKSKKEIVSKTYNDIRNDSMTFSNVLKSLDLLSNHIAVIGATSYEWIVTYFGTVNSNSVIVPIDFPVRILQSFLTGQIFLLLFMTRCFRTELTQSVQIVKTYVIILI